MLAVVEAGYRAGAAISDIDYTDPFAYRARMLSGSLEARTTVTPWRMRQYRELVKPTSARAHISGTAELGYLEGVPPKRIAESQAAVSAQLKWFQRANLDMRARWTIAAWPTDLWAGQVYPELSTLEGKKKLAQDFLWFCRLSDQDGAGSTGWLA